MALHRFQLIFEEPSFCLEIVEGLRSATGFILCGEAGSCGILSGAHLAHDQAP